MGGSIINSSNIIIGNINFNLITHIIYYLDRIKLELLLVFIKTAQN